MSFVFKSNRKKVDQAVEDAIDLGLEMVGLQAEGYAQEELTRQGAVDTGRLRNSITSEVTTENGMKYAIVGTNVEYAPYIEFGTYKMAPRPYLKPAAESHQKEYAEIIRSQLPK